MADHQGVQRERAYPEVRLMGFRVDDFAEGMVDKPKGPPKPYDWAEIDPRVTAAATFFIDAADCVDGVDHQTNDEMGGTDVIQDLAGRIRATVRDFMLEIREEL